jgi:predicted TIM-barrel fold metal-dependent hydrolase
MLRRMAGLAGLATITNCHAHTFTSRHTPKRFLPWPVADLARFKLVRRLLSWAAGVFDPKRQGALGRYAEILDTSFKKSQREVFEIVQGFYPEGTRVIVLPMDMTQMNAGPVEESMAVQHEQLARLRDAYPDTVIPFAAADPRHPDIADSTIRLLEEEQFRGVKLYPPTGYHPWDPALRPIYAYAEEHDMPVMTHCSRPASVQFRGTPTAAMQTNPETGQPYNLSRYELLETFTDPDAYRPIMSAHPELRICLAHFGGAGDWDSYLNHPWDGDVDNMSWLAKILDMIRSGRYPNLWTDISYTIFADDEYVYLLKVLLADARVAERVLFGSDFYVVENAQLEERHRAVRVRAVLGEDLFDTIARDNPVRYLGAPSVQTRASQARIALSADRQRGEAADAKKTRVRPTLPRDCFDVSRRPTATEAVAGVPVPRPVRRRDRDRCLCACREATSAGAQRFLALCDSVLDLRRASGIHLRDSAKRLERNRCECGAVERLQVKLKSRTDLGLADQDLGRDRPRRVHAHQGRYPQADRLHRAVARQKR